MNLLETIRVQRHGGSPGLVQLFQGDLTAMPLGEAVDVLVVSAFPHDYLPAPGTLIRALEDKGVSVGTLAEHPEADLRDAFSCWLSREIEPHRAGIEARRILCFEPHWKGQRENPAQPRHPAEAVEELYQALVPFTAGRWRLKRVAMSILAAGNIGCTVEEMARPLIDQAIRWMQNSPLECVKLVCFQAEDATRARVIFQEVKKEHALFDVFISYSWRDRVSVDVFVNHLRERTPDLSLFYDRSTLAAGDFLDQRICQAIRSCSFFVPFYSPHYFESDWCKDEFGMALARSLIDGRPRLFPLLLRRPETPFSKLLEGLLSRDCSGGEDSLREAGDDLIQVATGC